MKVPFLTISTVLLASPARLHHADAPPPPPAAPSARPSDEAIRAAVRAILDEMPADAMPAGGTALSGGAYREFARKFSGAEKPHCLGSNALKHQPAGFSTKNWNFGFGGLAALPFWGAAIARGKCSWSR